jgi:hypothetical protein
MQIRKKEPAGNKSSYGGASESDIRRLLSDLDKLEKGIGDGFFKRRPKQPSSEEDVLSEENGLPEKDKMVKRRNELKQLIEVLESEFRESTISEKTYKEAVNRSKQELLDINSKLKRLSPEEQQTEEGSSGRLLDLEKMKIEMQNQMNDLTLRFSKAEISEEDFNSKTEALEKQIQEIEGEIIRLGQGKSVVEAIPMGDEEQKEPDKKPNQNGIISQAMEVVPEEDEAVPEEDEVVPEETGTTPKEEETEPEAESRESEEKTKEPGKKKKKKRFSIRSKLFSAKEDEKQDKKKKTGKKSKEDKKEETEPPDKESELSEENLGPPKEGEL